MASSGYFWRGRRWSAAYVAKVFAFGLLASACASLSGQGVAERAWTGPADCFSRDVRVGADLAARVAEACGSDRMVGDPTKSGIDRATASFLAASAYSRLAEAGQVGPGCDTPRDCFARAARLIAQSRTHEGDDRIADPSAETPPGSDQRFVIRRTLEEARAFAGLAVSGGEATLCGSREACLTAASSLLSGIDLSVLPAGTDGTISGLACEAYGLGWQVQIQRGGATAPETIDLLNRLAEGCPDQRQLASDALAQIAFDRAERGRTLLVAADRQARVTAATLQAGRDAVSDYRSAASVDRFRLPVLRATGEIHLVLAAHDPDNTRSDLRAAINAFETLLADAKAPVDTSQRAKDLAELGDALVRLARHEVRARDGVPVQPLYRRAVEVLTQSVATAAIPSNALRLGEAHEALGQLREAQTAYEAAIAGLSGKARREARMSLVALLDRLGEADSALAMLETTAMEDPPTAQVRYQIGKRRFAGGDVEAAYRALQSVLPALTGEEKARAAYILSIGETTLRRAGWQDRALAFANTSLAADVKLWTYSRQACLAAIHKGTAQALAGNGASPCLDIATPEAHLLIGMSALKRAQQLDVGAYDMAAQAHWRSVLREAEAAFQSGLALLQQSGGHDRYSRFDDLGTQVDLQARLADGLRVVQRCRRDIVIDSASPEWRTLDAFFGHYGILRCSN